MVLSETDDLINAALILPTQTDSTLSKTGTLQTESFPNTPVDLFGPGGSAGSSVVALNAQQPSAEGCLVWPSARLTLKPSAPWKVGFAAGHAKPIQIDSIEKLSAGDSSSITAELSKQASVLTVNGDPAFRGLPFTVQKAYRLSMGDTTILIGNIVRKINEEATPREERLLLVVERISTTGSYVLSFQSRSAGSEDAVRTSAVLAAVRFVRTNKAAIVISFEYDDGGQLALLERIGDHDWRITWRSAYTGC